MAYARAREAKPWTVAELAGKVREVLDGAEAAGVCPERGQRRAHGGLSMV